MKPEERWMQKSNGWFQRLPAWSQGILMIWTILSIAFVMIDELHDNVPKWFSLVMVAPYLLIIILWVAPAMLMIWGRRLSWPFRKVHSMLGRRHDG